MPRPRCLGTSEGDVVEIPNEADSLPNVGGYATLVTHSVPEAKQGLIATERKPKKRRRASLGQAIHRHNVFDVAVVSPHDVVEWLSLPLTLGPSVACP